MRALLGLAIAATATTACVKTNAFKCEDDSACTGDGARCEPDGLCSVNSTTCESGRQYSDTAGDNANNCIGGGPNPDGPGPDDPPPDVPDPDGRPDMGGGNCDADYATITNGQQGHKYKLIDTTDEWSNQHNIQCVGDGAYLAIPDSAAELTAIAGLTANPIWVGVTDGPGNGNEGTFEDVLNVAYNSQARVGLDIGSNAQNKDCVKAVNNGQALDAEDCGQQLRAVCECND